MPGKPLFKGKPMASLTGTLLYRLSPLPVGLGSVRPHLSIRSFFKSLMILSSGLRHILIQSLMAFFGKSSSKTVNRIWT
ncbi:hypothetical protein [Kiloniella majae]|uniref:hypothetical protein n=1 Tax=Kiloniella majae TaxID=1938558 RepID=UPI000F78278B|nr:hypothetical protein [Kiloniella majae]